MLMTDMEGSTGLVQRLGDQYGGLLDEVCGILRDRVAAAGGYEVEARADEFFAVFASPRGAVDAAVAVQLALGKRPPVDETVVRVRIGIHSGYPTSTPGNYIGIDVNTASRICAAGHGGQIVVSDNTREAVKATRPEGLRFVALGEHHLRGLAAAAPLFQVAAKGLPKQFPALRTATRP
jgi:class 3 adenylate cyclase